MSFCNEEVGVLEDKHVAKVASRFTSTKDARLSCSNVSIEFVEDKELDLSMDVTPRFFALHK